MHHVAFSPDGKRLASGGLHDDIRLWDAAKGRDVRTIETDLSLFALAFSPHDGTLASGGVDRRVTLRDAGADAIVAAIPLTAPEMVAACGAFYDAVMEARVVHFAQAPLTAAVEGAKQRNLGDGWAWGRRTSAVNVSPLVAASLAVYGVLTYEAPKPRVQAFVM